ncbi:preprotein translocase subunit YajC [Nocardioides bigeumensis]|uniref:Preprotein translocase subunit YajC n=1 Tax=Nocardioides bigeumensis TaxID=433657 RepID=A0ABP5JV63_9ACTN
MPELASTLLPLAAIFLVFWLLIIRPQQRRQRALQDLRRSLAPGDRVMLTSGIFGTLVSSEGDRATVEIAPGTVIEIASGAVASVEHDVTSEPAEAADEVDGVDEDAHADDGTEPREGR